MPEQPKPFTLPATPIVAGAQAGYLPGSWKVNSAGQFTYSIGDYSPCGCGFGADGGDGSIQFGGDASTDSGPGAGDGYGDGDTGDGSDGDGDDAERQKVTEDFFDDFVRDVAAYDRGDLAAVATRCHICEEADKAEAQWRSTVEANSSAGKSDGDGETRQVSVCNEYGCNTYQVPVDGRDPNAPFDGTRPVPPLLLPPTPPYQPESGTTPTSSGFRLTSTVAPIAADGSDGRAGCGFGAAGCASGQYAPRLSGGEWLLAHELVHVAQQRWRPDLSEPCIKQPRLSGGQVHREVRFTGRSV